MRFRSLVVFFLGLLLIGCSGGGGGSGERVTARLCSGTDSFCVIGCNLSCGASGACGVTEIAQNQPLEFRFNNAIDPSTVNAASVSLKTASGEKPFGEFRVNGSLLTFLPEVIVAGASTSFGFRNGETYILAFPGGPDDPQTLRSVSGDRLGATLNCSLTVSLGLVDADGVPPQGTLVTPANIDAVPLDSAIEVEFSELIDVGPFLIGDTLTSPVKYEMRLTKLSDPNDPNSVPICDPDFAPVRIIGTPRPATEIRVVDVGQGPVERQVTVVTLVPDTPLPERVCVQVRVTTGVRDLLGNPAQEEVFEFFTLGNVVGQQVVTEDFDNADLLDESASSGSWGGGVAVPGRLGGSGVHGSFDYRLGKDLGGGTFQFSTERQLIPGDSALFGDDVLVQDGVFQFTDMVIPEGIDVVFRGPKAAIIFVQGNVDIRGRLSVDGEAADANFNARSLADGVGGFTRVNPGEPGRNGGAFGGLGGAGGESCKGLGGIIIGPGRNTPSDGRAGEGLQVPGTSAYVGSGANSGGKGSMVFPLTGDALLLSSAFARFGAFHPNASSQINGGGGGGGFFAPGGLGEALMTHQTDGVPQDLGTGGSSGSAVTFVPPQPGATSFDHFLLGGSGGGGGGSHAINMEPLAYQPEGSSTSKGPALGLPWHAGASGGGGGGALGLRIGRDLLIADTGSLASRGGGGTVYGTGKQIQENGPPAPGGGGSGGSLVLQVGRFLENDGTVDVRGGAGGRIDGFWTAGSFSGLGFFWPLLSVGGDGAPGYVRFESEVGTSISTGTVLGPASLGPDNFGDLIDSDDVTGFRSKWIDTNLDFPPKWDHYEITARIGGQTVVFTDNPESFNPATSDTSPEIQFFLQGSGLNLDPFTGGLLIDPATNEPFAPPGEWRSFANSEDGKGSLNLDRARAFRFMFIFDRSIASDIEVDQVKVFFSR